MSTYENCYEILGDLRRELNEYSTGFHNGTDTTGPHSNSYLVKQINKAQRYLYGILIQRIPEQFLESTTLTGVNSVYTFPADFGRLLYFKDENGNQVYPFNPKEGRLVAETGNDNLYYRKGNTLVLDKASVTKTYTLLYYRKPRDLDQGLSSAGGALSITLASSAKKIIDYYNNMTIENITDDEVDTITDYTTARVATISGTGAASKYYGIVSDLPEPFHFLIAPKATHFTKLGSSVVQEKPSSQDIAEWNAMLAETVKGFVGSDDGDIESLFCDYDNDYSYGYGTII